MFKICFWTYWHLSSFCVPCCNVRYDFHIKTMFGSSLPLFVCRRTFFYVICVCLRISLSNTSCFVFFLRLVYPMLPVSLDCPFLIAPSLFSNVHWLTHRNWQWRKIESETLRADFNYLVVNLPSICSNILAAPAYGVCISQLIRYIRSCLSYQDFLDRGRSLFSGVLVSKVEGRIASNVVRLWTWLYRISLRNTLIRNTLIQNIWIRNTWICSVCSYNTVPFPRSLQIIEHVL
jgi:hypothetical protein